MAKMQPQSVPELTTFRMPLLTSFHQKKKTAFHKSRPPKAIHHNQEGLSLAGFLPPKAQTADKENTNASTILV